MPKFKIVCVLLAAVIAAVGTVLVVKNLVGGEDIPFFVKPNDDPNTYLELTDDVDITNTDTDVREFLFIAHKVLLDSEGFYGLSTGSTTAAGIKQNVRNSRYVIGEFDNKHVLKEMVTSGVVKNGYQLYMTGKNYIYRESAQINSLEDVKWSNDAQPLTEEAFYNGFGHRNDKLTGYILNWDTVLSGALTGVDNGIYTFRYVLDTEESTTYLRREMITNGGLKGEPTFSKCEISVAMDANFNIQSLTTDCAYKADLGFLSAECSEDITEVFEPYVGELPHSDFYKDYLDKDGGDIEDKLEALDVLLAMFAPYLSGEDLQVELLATQNGSKLASALLSVSGLDISDLSKLQVAAKLGDVEVAYRNSESAIYLKYQDFQGSTTVSGILGLVDTITSLLSDGASVSKLDASFLDDFDAESLLENLTFTIYDNDTKCVVNLPISIAGLDINANLYADIDGENFTFTYATVSIGEVELTISPKAWTVAEIDASDYPEILGLVDLIQNGKLALTANVGLTVGDNNFAVSADVLFDLATKNLQVTATLDRYGVVIAKLVDGVAYVSYGEIKVKLDTANVDQLIAKIQELIGGEISVDMPEINVGQLLGALSGITATKGSDGRVAFELSLDSFKAAIYLNSVSGRWQLDTIVVAANGIDAVVTPSDKLDEITAPSDADSYADITELVETFTDPILNLLNATSFGADFELTLTVNGKDYRIIGSFALDICSTVLVNATVYSGNVGIIDVQVIYANDVVFLTFNGINVAFEVGNGASDVDIDALIEKLADNEQIKEFLSNHEQLSQLVEQLVGIVEKVSNYQLSDLLNVDFSAVVSRFSFVDGVLSLTVEGSAFGFDGLSVDLTLANDNGLVVTVSGLSLASVSLDVAATVKTDVETVVVPNAEDYVLNLHLQILDADVEVSADFVNMDIWARIQYNSEVLLLRYVDGKVYVQYGGANVALDTTDLDAVIGKIRQLVGNQQSNAMPSFDVVAVLAAISANLTGNEPNVSLEVKGVSIKVNFVNNNGKLVFSSITVNFEINGSSYAASVVQQSKLAEKLDVDGEFVDANALLLQLLTTVEALADGKVFVSANFDVLVNGKNYVAEITLNLNGGIYAKALLKDGSKQAVLSAEIYLVDGVLYFDVNGIRQAVGLPEANGEFDLEQLAAIVAQLKGQNDKLDEILQSIASITDRLDGIVFSHIIQSVKFSDGELVVELNLDQFDLSGVVVTLSMGEQLALSVKGFAINNFALDAEVGVCHSDDVVTAPDLDSYVTELKLTVGEVTAYVKLDLYNKKVLGVAYVYGETINFKYYNGVIYATLGSQNRVGIKFSLDDLDALLDAISRFVELPDTSISDVNFAETIESLLQKISIERQITEEGYTLQINYDGISIAVDFACSDSQVTLASVKVDVGNVTVSAKQVSGVSFVDLSTNGNYVDVVELATAFAEPIAELINATGYAISFDGSLVVGSKTYALQATLTLKGSNVHVVFKLSYNNVTMLDGELWVVDRTLYLHAGDLKLALELEETAQSNDEFTIESLKETLNSAMGYNESVDKIIELVMSLLDTDVQDISFEQLLSALTFNGNELKLVVNGSQFGVSSFTLGIGANNGLGLWLKNFSYGDITLNVNSATVAAYDAEIIAPGGDFTTNLVIDVQEFDKASNTSGERNVIYVNIDLLQGVVLGRIETTMKDGSKSFLDVKYTLADNVLKLTNGGELNVLVNINNIADIVDRINDIVNEFAGAGDNALPDLFGSLGGDLDLKSIVSSLSIRNENGKVLVGLSAMGFDVTAAFKNGFNSVTIPVELIESNLVVELGGSVTYSDFSDDNSKYVSIDQVFDDYYYGLDGKESESGPIYNLVHTNSWKFDFKSDSEIDVLNDDGTTTKYQILHGSYVAFYFNKTERDNFKVRANITVQKDGGEFLYLDVAFIDGRIYATYDSRKADGNTNELKVTLSLDAIKETIDLLPALIDVIPQIGTLIDSMKDALSNAESKLTLGNVSKILHSVSYGEVDGRNVFTLQINGQAIDATNFGAKPITLKVSNFGDEGLSLDELSLTYGSVSVNIVDLVVTGSLRNQETGEFEYVENYVNTYFSERGAGAAKGEAASGYDATNDHGYDMSNHMNFDSIRELLAALAITAGNFDNEQHRSFLVEGNVSVNLSIIGLDLINLNIGVTMYADIDEEGYSYFALKLTRVRERLALSDIYNDRGGNSYLTFNSQTKLFSVVRDSIQERTWCTTCGSYTCTADKILGVSRHATKHKSVNVYDSMYNADVYEANNIAPVEGTPSYKAENITAEDFMSNLIDGERYLFKMLNLGSVLGINLENTIVNAINKPNDNVYGIEDILKTYTYTFNGNGGVFEVTADLSPISSSLGTLNVNILHSGDLGEVTFDENGKPQQNGVMLTDITGGLNIAGSMIEISLDLHHSTPGFGTAQDYVTKQNFVW